MYKTLQKFEAWYFRVNKNVSWEYFAKFQLNSYLIDAIVTYCAKLIILSQNLGFFQFWQMLKNRYLYNFGIFLDILIKPPEKPINNNEKNTNNNAKPMKTMKHLWKTMKNQRKLWNTYEKQWKAMKNQWKTMKHQWKTMRNQWKTILKTMNNNEKPMKTMKNNATPMKNIISLRKTWPHASLSKY